MRRIPAVVSIALLLAVGLSACGRKQEPPGPELTERQRDSILAREPLPGAGVVGRALATSDSAAARAARMDSLSH